MTLWIPFVVAPFVIAFAMVLGKHILRLYWLGLFVLVACAEVMLLGSPSPNWSVQNVVATWTLTIFLPWVSVAIWLFVSPFPKDAWITGLGLPIAFFLFAGIGYFVGDYFGLIPL
jgi:hypothetical protein